MPIGAVIGSAVVGAGANLISSKNNSKAIDRTTAAQTQANNDSIALQRETRDINTGILSPFVQRGNAAGNQINALLGLGGSAQVPTSALGPYSGGGEYQAGANPGSVFAPYEPGYYAGQDYGTEGGMARYEDYGQIGGDTITGRSRVPWMPSEQSQPNAFAQFDPGQVPAGSVPSGPRTAQQAATDAYEIFKASTGYQTRLTEGYRGTNAGYAGRGLLQSGAAQKALLRYGQDQASGEFGNYIGYLANQQGVGLSGASALAGVGQGYANNVTNLNTANANALGQAAVARANNSNATIGGIANIFGNTVGALSSYGGGGGSSPFAFAGQAAPFYAHA